ncbi:MAG: aminotransferase class I/II-fold pyridoxal phosphate-dependent enzyme [Kiritimatiellae bacterium]|nr:aminotransferase class I/II-fold pyridoxal phosphate-dependent enzyme [Kiritimatiellia bacterium]
MKGSKSPRNFIASHLENVPKSGIRDFFDIVSTRKDIISLSIGEPDFVTPWHIREASIFALDHGATAYTANLGLLELRQLLSKYVHKSFGINYDPVSEILVTVGVSEAMDLAIRAITEPGDEIIYHEPCFVSYAPVIIFAHGKPVPVITAREEEFRLTPDLLEKRITGHTKALVLNFPTNPTGAVLDRNDIEGIADLVIKHDLLVITDEIYSELTYDGERLSIGALPGMKERTIFLNGFSKTWAMTGFRVGFSCAPPHLTDAMMKIHQYIMMCAPILSQKAAIEALRNGHSDIIEMRSEYKKRRNFICSSLNEMGLPCHVPKGAFYAFPYIGDYGMTAKEFSLRLLDEENVACVPGTAFGNSGEGFLRCSYAADMDDIKEAMNRMERFVKRLQKK